MRLVIRGEGRGGRWEGLGGVGISDSMAHIFGVTLFGRRGGGGFCMRGFHST